MAGPILAAIGLIGFYPFGREIELGQVHLLIPTAMLVGFRYPAAWSFVLLTKITPGIGLLWFAARREWRSLMVAAATTLTIRVVSFVLAPDLWGAWIARMASDRDAAPHPDAALLVPLPLWLRLVLAAAVSVWAARADRPWALFLAAFLAMPLATLGRLAVVGGAIHLLLERRRLTGHLSANRDAVDVGVLGPRRGHEI